MSAEFKAKEDTAEKLTQQLRAVGEELLELEERVREARAVVVGLCGFIYAQTLSKEAQKQARDLCLKASWWEFKQRHLGWPKGHALRRESSVQ